MAFNLLALTPEEAIASLFVGYFDRAPTPGGLEYWAGRLTDEEDPMTLAEIAASFAVQPESQGLYPQLGGDGGSSLSTNIAFVKNVFNNLFGRDPNNLGPDNYWVNKLENGADVGQLIVDIMSGAQGADKELLQNKIEVGLDWAETAEANGVASGDNPMTTKDDDGNLVILDQGAYDFARSVLKGVNTDVDSVADAKDVINGYFSQYQDNTVFTLTEAEQTTITTIRAEYSEPVLVTMWGYNPHGHSETGVDNLDGNNAGSDAFDDEDSNLQGNDNNLTNEGPLDGGVPLSHLIAYIEGLAGLDFAALDLIDVEFGGSTSLDDINVTQNADNAGTVTISVTNGEGEVAQAEVEMSDYYFGLLSDLLLDNEGNSRLYQQELYIVYDPEGDMVTEQLNGVTVPVYSTSPTELVPASVNSVTDIVPIILTPAENNGGTLEPGYTSDANDLIQAGRLELLHQARIDGGEGYNTLEIDAKGHYAQPLSLLNVQAISIENLPNVYTDGSGDSTYPELGALQDGPLANSVIDLSRATDLDILTITEGDFVGVVGQQLPGDLLVTGVRDNATLKLEGDFARANDTTTTVRYSEGMTDGDGLNLILALGDTEGATFNILGNSATVNIESTGGGNAIDANFGKSSLLTMNISGDAFLEISSDLAPQFQANTPATIDASANTAGVDLQIGGEDSFSDEVHITGSSASDHFDVSTLRSADIAAGEGDNELRIVAAEDITVSAGEGDNQITTSTATSDDGLDNEIVTTITVGGGDNDITVVDTEIFAITAGDGDNRIDAISSASGGSDLGGITEDDVSTIVLGDGQNEVNASAKFVDVQAGEGANEILLTNAASATVVAGDGGNTIGVDAAAINVTTGSGDDTVTVVGTSNDYLVDGADLQINVGGGSNTIVLGADQVSPGSITAKSGSSISGENITLMVENASDLRAADLDGITNVILNYDISTSYNEALRSYEASPALTLTDTQFAAIGAENFDVIGAEFSQYAQVKIIITESGSLADLGVANLPAGVDVIVEIQDGVQLEIDAELLHTKVAPQGVILADDNNTDQLSGSVLITGAGPDFDPFNSGDYIRTDIDGDLYFGGSLSYEDFSSSADQVVQRGEWGSNVLIDRTLSGYDRPEDAQSYSRLTINTDDVADGTIGPIETIETFLRIVGDSDIAFVPQAGGIDEWGRPIEAGTAINLGVDSGAYEDMNPFIVDFSSVTGSVENLTFGNFENAAGIYGNGTSDAPARVNVELGGNLGDAEQGLVSRGVQHYVVYDLNGEDREFWTCETTMDLEVLGLRGNYGDAITFGNTERGVQFLLEVDYSKADGYAVGELNGLFARAGADAVVDIVGLQALPEGEVQIVEGITLVNADSVTINVEGGDTLIEDFTGADLTSLTVTADGDITFGNDADEDLPGGIADIDASGVVGVFTASVDGDDLDGPFTFVGGDGGAVLTLDDFAEGAHVIDGGAGGVTLIIDWGTIDLSSAALTNVTSVVLNNGANLTITMDQADVIGAGNFSLADGASGATLNLEGLSDQVFALANYEDGIDITLTLANDPVVTLNPATDLTGISGLVVPAGTLLQLTAAQFQQLDGAGTITGDGSVHITDMTQADVGEAGEDLSLDDIDVDGTVSVTLAEDVNLSDADVLSDVDTYNIGDGLTLILGDVANGNGVAFEGGENSTLQFTDLNGFLQTIDASGINVDFLRITDLLVSGNNVDYIFAGLIERVTKVVYNGDGDVEGRLQNVVIEEGTTIFGDISFNEYGLDTEISVLTLNLEGGTWIEEDLVLSTVEVNIGDDDLIPAYLQELIINSNGTAGNNITGNTANIISGDITPAAYGPAVGLGSRDNNLKTVTITAEQDFELQGSIIFNSHGSDDILGNKPNDGITANDDDAATATLNVSGSASVYIDDIDTDDDDVDFLVINNLGTGDLNIGISDTNTVDADDVITYNGSVEGTDTIRVTGTRDFSGDTLIDVDQMVFDSASDDTTITVTQAQFDAIGVENFLTTEDDDEDDGNAILNITEFGEDPFDATALDPDIDLNEITIVAEDEVTLDPSTNLTGVSQINVPGGTTLNLTAAQFQQLDGNGTIVSTDGEPININITGLTQADIDGGSFDLGDIDPAEGAVTLSLAESVELSDDDDLTLGGDDGEEVEVLLADGQDLGLAKFEQADGLDVTGTGTTDVFFRFMTDEGGDPVDFFTSLDASGFNVSQLHALNTFVGGTNIEYILDDLPSSTTLVIYYDPEQLGMLNETDRVVIIEAGTTVDNLLGSAAALAFNDLDNGDEVRSVTITGLGGTIISGDIVFGTETDDEKDGVRNFLQSFTYVSEGDGSQVNADDETTTANVIDGDITPVPAGASGNLDDNDLLNVDLIANNALEITGTIFFNSNEEEGVTATLSTSGTAPITIKALDTTDADIDTLVIDHTGTGVLTITAGSDALEMDNTGNLIITGSGDIVLDTDEGVDNSGIEGNELVNLDASEFTGNLTLGVIEDVDSDTFSFTAGTGVTTATLTDDNLTDDGDGWSFDFTQAAAGSKLDFAPDWVPADFEDGANLSFDMGANAQLCISTTVDLSGLNLSFAGDLPIVLNDGVTLTLTAEQASGLNIVAAPGATANVVIEDLGAYEDLNLNGSNDDAAELFDYDFSGIQVPASATLFDDDVTLSAASDLGNVAINLYALSNSNETLAGQTIRFNSEEQADGRVINVVDGGGSYVDPGEDGDTTNSTNVIWLFDSVSGTLDTSSYDPEIGRVWFTEELANGANIEDLFSSLPEAILRVDFGDLTELATLLQSVAVDRTIELASFIELPDGIEFSDLDQLEHIESLTVKMGGEVTVGDILIGNIVNPEEGVNSGSITFDTLTIDSVLADDTGDLLATEGYDEDVNVRPEGVNVVGDIGVGPNDNLNEFGLDLTDVILNVGFAQLGAGGSDYIEATQALIEAYDNGSGDNEDTYEALVAFVDAYGEELLDFLGGSIEITGGPDGDVTLTSKDELLDYLELIELDIVAALTNAGNWSDILSAINGFGAAEFGASSGDIADGDADTGADLVVGTITFDTEGTDETATLDVNGGNFIDIKGVDVSDAGFTSFVIDVTEFPALATGNDLTFTGGSPAVTLGENVETMSISGEEVFGEDEPSVYEQIVWAVGEDSFFGPDLGSGGQDLTIRFGYEWVDTNEDGIRDDDEYIIHRDGEGNPYAGIYGPELSLLEVDGNSGHDVHFGYLADIDGTDDGPFSPAFELIGDLTGQTTSATLGAANVDGDIVAPELEAGSTWRFVDVDLTIDEETIFQDDSNLEIFESNLFITDGNDVDLSGVNLDIDNSTIRVEEGGSLTLTVEQVLDLLSEGIIITGSGTVNVVGDATADYTYDFGSGDVDLDDIELAFALGSVLKTSNVNVSGVTIDTDTDNGGGFSLGLFGGALPDSIEADTIAYLEATEALTEAYGSGSGDDEETYTAFVEWADTYAGDFIDAFGPIEITGGPEGDVTLESEQDVLDYLFLIRNDIVSALSNGDNWSDLSSGFEAFLELQFFNKGQSVVGSDNDDLLITLNFGDNTFEGGEGNDVYIGDFGSGGMMGSGDVAPGNNTYVVTAGSDIIFNLEADEVSDSDEVWFKQDTLTVSEGATAYGLVSDEFVATSETTNDGEAILIGGGLFGGGDTLLDVSEAGGTAGFTLVGGAADGSASGSGDFFDEIFADVELWATGEGADENVSILIGSANADTIIDGGLSSGDNDGVEDTLTGNAGSDTFVFSVGLSDIAEITDVVDEANYDYDVLTFDGAAPTSGDEANDDLTVTYVLNGSQYTITLFDDSSVGGIDFSDRSAVAQALADNIDDRGAENIEVTFTAGVSGGEDIIEIVGTDGAYFDIVDIQDVVGGDTTYDINFDSVGDIGSGSGDIDEDDPQVSTVTVSGVGSSVGGELYELTITVQGDDYTVEYTTSSGDGDDEIAAGLALAVNTSPDLPVTAAHSGTDTFFTLTTDEGGDLGGFTVSATGTAQLEVSSASSILDGGEVDLADADADEITDFMVDDDFISFGLGAGDDDNFDSGTFHDTYSEAYDAANGAFNTPGLLYFFTGYNDDASGDADGIEGDVGLLFVNANGGTEPDTVIQLTGVSEGTFDFDNIV
jgi:hypothetical protein